MIHDKEQKNTHRKTGIVVGILVFAIVGGLAISAILYNVSRKRPPRSKALMYIDVAALEPLDALKLRICGTLFPFQKMSERFTMEVFRENHGQNTATHEATFGWEGEVNWNTQDEPCSLAIVGLREDEWTEYRLEHGFSGASAIQAGVSFGFGLNRDSTVSVYFWP